MGAPKTSTVGGGADTATAGQYQGFLQGQLGGTGVTNATNNLLNGNTDPTKNQGAGMANLPSAPTFTPTSFNPLGTNVNLSQYNTSTPNGGVPDFSTLQGLGAQNAAGVAGFQPTAGGNQGTLANTQAAANLNYSVPTINQPNADVNSARANAIKAVTDQQNALNLANTRQYFSAGGMGSQGSGSMLAQAQQNAYGQNQLLQGLQGVTQQDIQNTAQYGQLNSQNQLASLGLQQSGLLGSAGLANTQQLGNYQISNTSSIANMQAALQAALGGGQLGLGGLQNALSGATSGGALNLQGLGLNSSNSLNQFNANNSATQTNNSNNFANNSSLNSFVQSLFGQNSQNALGNQSLGNNFGLGSAQLGQSGVTSILNNLFGGFNQANQIGTPQAQNIQQPSFLQSLTGGLSGLSSLLQGLKGIGGLGGGGGGGGGSTATGDGSPTGGSGNNGASDPSEPNVVANAPGNYSSTQSPQINQLLALLQGGNGGVSGYSPSAPTNISAGNFGLNNIQGYTPAPTQNYSFGLS